MEVDRTALLFSTRSNYRINQIESKNQSHGRKKRKSALKNQKEGGKKGQERIFLMARD